MLTSEHRYDAMASSASSQIVESWFVLYDVIQTKSCDVAWLDVITGM